MSVAHRIVEPAAPVPGFEHVHAAHCENGVTKALLRDVGLELSEPTVFGIGSGLFFAHFSFVRIMGHPLTTFRSIPGSIFKKTCDRLGIEQFRESYRDPTQGMRRLDGLLEEGRHVGLQVNIYWLPYIPKAMRIHFNGHNLIALARRGDNYVVSDPIMETEFECSAEALQRARFSGGPSFIAKGLAYHPVRRVREVAVADAVALGLQETCHRMTRIPGVVPWLSVQGMGHLGRRIPKWPAWYGERRAQEWLAGVVRLQEEIGTGGAGFRYLFAAFVQEAAQQYGFGAIGPFADQVTAIGDRWRTFALEASRQARGRKSIGWDALGAMVVELGDAEYALFQELDRARTARLLATA